MNNQNNVFIGLRAVLFIMLQILIFSNLDLMNYIDPYVYILIVFWHPLSTNKINSLLFAFFVGLAVDLFLYTGAVHAGALVFVMFIREYLIKFSLGLYEIETKNIYIGNENISKQIVYLTLLVIFYHSFLFLFENLGLQQLGNLSIKIVLSSLITIFICTCILIINRRKQNG